MNYLSDLITTVQGVGIIPASIVASTELKGKLQNTQHAVRGKNQE